MRVRDEADMAARIAASMAGPCPTVAYVPRAVLCADRDETNCRIVYGNSQRERGAFLRCRDRAATKH